MSLAGAEPGREGVGPAGQGDGGWPGPPIDEQEKDAAALIEGREAGTRQLDFRRKFVDNKCRKTNEPATRVGQKGRTESPKVKKSTFPEPIEAPWA